jgi:urease accessory protein
MRVRAIADDDEGIIDEVILDFAERSRRRSIFLTVGGLEIVLDQQRPSRIRGGQAFVLEDGRKVRIVARAEQLTAIRCESAGTLVRLAWHLGNRHLPTQILAAGEGGELRIRTDHVIEEMATRLGGHCARIEAPFDPEGGAYEDGGSGHHLHHHGAH